jgi:hypothetical protein
VCTFVICGNGWCDELTGCAEYRLDRWEYPYCGRYVVWLTDNYYTVVLYKGKTLGNSSHYHNSSWLYYGYTSSWIQCTMNCSVQLCNHSTTVTFHIFHLNIFWMNSTVSSITQLNSLIQAQPECIRTIGLKKLKKIFQCKKLCTYSNIYVNI